ncbi:hypothetical protein HOY82DRAFT_604086 [Tuber indicum]|nr:hypothetical protein HOY82DRAFT_604086 [Tuber indicum]
MVSTKRKNQINLSLQHARVRKRIRNNGRKETEFKDKYNPHETEDSDFERIIYDSEYDSGDSSESECDLESQDGLDSNNGEWSDEQEIEDQFDTESSAKQKDSESTPQQISDLKYYEGADHFLKTSWGSGSKCTERRKRAADQKLKTEASQCYDIRGLWSRGKQLAICVTSRGLAQAVASYLQSQNKLQLTEKQVEANSQNNENANAQNQEIVEDLVVQAMERVGIDDGVKEAYHQLSPYLVEFDLKWKIKDKTYPEDCIVGGLNPPIILATHDENSRRGIMISDFLLPCGCLTAESLSFGMRQQLVLEEHASLLFEFGSQNNQEYWSTEDVINHTLNSAIKIFEAVYPGYQGLFLYDNASSHSSFADDALRIQNMHLCRGGEQAILRDGNFLQNGIHNVQPRVDEEGIPKGIEVVLHERDL